MKLASDKILPEYLIDSETKISSKASRDQMLLTKSPRKLLLRRMVAPEKVAAA
jgi:hypothetical protein